MPCSAPLSVPGGAAPQGVSHPGQPPVALQAAVLRDPHAIDAERLARVTGEELQELVGWERPLPLQGERARLLREVGSPWAFAYKAATFQSLHTNSWLWCGPCFYCYFELPAVGAVSSGAAAVWHQGALKPQQPHPHPHTPCPRPQVGRGLLESYGGQAANLVRAANRSAARLVRLVTAVFPGFRDHAIYR